MHILLGSNAEQMLCNIQEYIIKYGKEKSTDFFRAILFDDKQDADSIFYEAVPVQDDANTFVAGIDNLYSVKAVEKYRIPAASRSEYLKSFFSELYNRQVTINNPGDSTSLHVCFHLQTYDAKCWSIIKEFLGAINSIPQNYNVDLLLLPYDLAYLFEKEVDLLPLKVNEYQQQTKKTINEIIEFNKTQRQIAHAVLLQNCNSAGIALDLVPESFVRIIGEYTLLSLNHYQELFNPAAEAEDRLIHALGLSVLSFDKYYFVQYLLHKAYINILDREKVLQEEVDVNKVSQIVQKILKENVDIFTSFYNKSVKERLDRGVHQDEIIAQIHPELQAEVARLTDVFQSFVDDDNLSLPEKKATLAQLLGEDDDLLTGYMFNKRQLVIDDCAREVLDLFVQLNNNLAALYPTSASENAEAGTENTEKTEKEVIAEYAALSGSNKSSVPPASAIIEDVKAIKVRMRESSNYIRHKSEELEGVEVLIKDNKESQKRLTREGFIFEGKTYQLQANVTEIPCSEDYVPKTNLPAKVDLRPFFTTIKDQGGIGACSAFSIVGIFEYILKRNSVSEPDLSESFVYYNVRKANNKENEDTGSSLFEVISSITDKGVCHERFCPYSETLDVNPSQEAYDDAQNNKIIKALNVKGSLEDIKSALSEGYPVAISLKIYDSFEPVEGFISRPTSEEIAGESGNHAMILCGYSEEEKIFIVRNSWGTRFGDRGYCYIPYSYISDPNLMNVACIITQISDNKLTVGGKDNKTTISFDMSNSQIKAAILKNLIEEEKVNLATLSTKYNAKTVEYNTLTQLLGNNATRNSICEGSIKRLEMETRDLHSSKSRIHTERTEQLEAFDKETKVTKWVFWGVVAVLLLTFGLVCNYSDSIEEVLFNTVSYIVYGLSALGVLLFILWSKQRNHKRVDLDEDYKHRLDRITDEITRRNKEIEIIHIKTHVAGMIIDSLSKLSKNLQTKYNGMKSYVGNLKVWRAEEEESVKIEPMNREPFLSLISNSCLDSYFEGQKDNITQEIRLSSMFKNQYNIGEEQIVKFKNTLKATLIKALWTRLEGFSIYKHVVGEEKYSYVDRRYTDVNELLQQMDKKSDAFVRKEAVIESRDARNTNCKLLFLSASLESERAKWNELCKHNFQHEPTLCSTNTDDKITLLQIVGMSTDEISLLKR